MFGINLTFKLYTKECKLIAIFQMVKIIKNAFPAMLFSTQGFQMAKPKPNSPVVSQV
jgi:hypothetical protein